MTRRAFGLQRAEPVGPSLGGLKWFVGISTILVVGLLATLGSRPPEIGVDATKLTLHAAGYGATVLRADIDSVRLVRRVTGIGARERGFQFANVFVGRFHLRPLGTVQLFVNRTRPPHVVVFARTGIVIVTAADSVATRRLYETLTVATRGPSRGQSP